MAKKKSATKRKYKDIAAWISAQPKAERPKLRAALRELRRLWKRPKRKDLLWWHEMGTHVGVLLPKGIDRHYSSAVVELIADHLERGRDPNLKYIPNLLYRYRDFAHMYSQREARDLDEKRQQHGLTALHFTALVSLKDKDLGKELLRQCIKGKWKGQELRREIQGAVGRKRSSGGRKPKPPKSRSSVVALRDLFVQSRRWMAFHEVWFDGKPASLGRIPVKDRNEATMRELKQAAGELTKVKKAVDEGLTQLRRLARDIEETLESRSQARGVRKR